MPKHYDVDWNGPQVQAIVRQASMDGINITMGACVAEAQPNTPYVTGNLRRSIKIQELAKQEGGVIAGYWGSADVNYALAVEEGTKGGTVQVQAHDVRAHTRKIRAVTQQVRAHTRGPFTRETTPREGVFMLQNAAKNEYPKLAGRISDRVSRRLARQRRGGGNAS